MRSIVIGVVLLSLLAPQSRVSEVQVAPAAATVTAGQTQRLHAMAYDGSGNVIASGVRYTWSSNNVNVARVDSVGTVTAVAAGTAIVKAEAIGTAKSGSATVTVRRP